MTMPAIYRSESFALYISKKSALRDGIRHAQARGVSVDTILAKTKVKPVYTRGELRGYTLTVPINNLEVRTIREYQDGQLSST